MYDRLERAYLEVIMRKLGLCREFVDLVMMGFRSVTFLVLFNGHHTRI